MKILFAFDCTGRNPFIDETVNALKKETVVIASKSKFLNCDNESFDIVQLQWPETYINKSEINEDELVDISRILNYWTSEGVKLILTVHNLQPHIIESLPRKIQKYYKQLYFLFNKYCHGFIHMSSYSQRKYIEIYGSNNKYHVLIPHGMYTSYLNKSNTNESKTYLNIPDDKVVILIFGMLRHIREFIFLYRVCKKTRNRYYFIIARASVINNTIGFREVLLIFIKDLLRIILCKISLYKLKKSFLNVFKHIRNSWIKIALKYERSILINYRYIDDKYVQHYFNASDLVFLPRYNILNSGVIPLAFSFSKTVVGPDCGSIKEILLSSNNETYVQLKVNSAVLAIDKGIKKSIKGQGIKNYEFGNRYWNWDLVSKKTIDLYSNILKVKP